MGQSSLFIFVIVLGVLFSTLLTGIGATFSELDIDIDQMETSLLVDGFDVPFTYKNQSYLPLLGLGHLGTSYDLYVYDTEEQLFKSGLQNQIDDFNTLNASYDAVFTVTIRRKYLFMNWFDINLNLRASVSPEHNEMEAISYWLTTHSENFESLTDLSQILQSEPAIFQEETYYFYENQNDMMNAYIGLSEYENSLIDSLNSIRLNFAKGLSYIPTALSVPLGLIYGLILSFLIYRGIRGY